MVKSEEHTYKGQSLQVPRLVLEVLKSKKQRMQALQT